LCPLRDFLSDYKKGSESWPLRGQGEVKSLQNDSFHTYCPCFFRFPLVAAPLPLSKPTHFVILMQRFALTVRIQRFFRRTTAAPTAPHCRQTSIIYPLPSSVSNPLPSFSLVRRSDSQVRLAIVSLRRSRWVMRPALTPSISRLNSAICPFKIESTFSFFSRS